MKRTTHRGKKRKTETSRKPSNNEDQERIKLKKRPGGGEKLAANGGVSTTSDSSTLKPENGSPLTAKRKNCSPPYNGSIRNPKGGRIEIYILVGREVMRAFIELGQIDERE